MRAAEGGRYTFAVTVVPTKARSAPVPTPQMTDVDSPPPVRTRSRDAESDGSPEANGPDGPRVCEFCGRRFAREDWLVLHRGLEHGDRLSPAEYERFQETYEGEEEELNLFRLKALALLVLVYFGFLIVYAFVT
ncbi:C2H2-type zinc finger protein [Halomarina pelagica]|uniref:C2H2-type zinc finger protein n=1 Tax=Halomarina pelagica TaxID=2961599 RepID=UPI0020C21D8A|nr:C2H2-type zinc finger protein [Halomarina sp. BND7]